MYVKVPPRRAQNHFPDFDTSVGSENSFAYFFRENRFFGGDRVGDTEHVALAITSRTIDHNSGRQRLKLSLGQVFYIEDRILGLPGEPPAREDTSGLFGEITAAVAEGWALSGFVRQNAENGNSDTWRVSANFRGDQRRSANLAYTYERDVSEQINLALQMPVAARWQLQGSSAYSLQESRSRSSAIEIIYDGCCWAARVGASRYLDGNGEYKERLVFTLELNDFGRIRSRW